MNPYKAQKLPVEYKIDKGYNRAMGNLFIVYGVIFIMLGLPLLSEQNSFYILFSVLGVIGETIAIMAIYSLYITKKYEK